jgi:hypothetical protein
MVSLQILDNWPFILVAFLIVLVLVFMNMKTERKPMIVGGSCGTVSPNSRCACCSSKPNDAWCKSNPCKSEKFQIQKKQNKKPTKKPMSGKKPMSAKKKIIPKKPAGGKKPVGAKKPMGGKKTAAVVIAGTAAVAAGTAANTTVPSIVDSIVDTPVSEYVDEFGDTNLTTNVYTDDNGNNDLIADVTDDVIADVTDDVIGNGTYDDVYIDDAGDDWTTDVVQDDTVDDELEIREIDDRYFTTYA